VIFLVLGSYICSRLKTESSSLPVPIERASPLSQRLIALSLIKLYSSYLVELNSESEYFGITNRASSGHKTGLPSSSFISGFSIRLYRDSSSMLQSGYG